MLPNLHALRLEDGAAPVGTRAKDSPEAWWHVESPNERKRGRFTVGEPPSDRAAVEAKYPMGTRVAMEGTLEAIRKIPALLDVTEPQSRWFFSSNGFNARVQAVRADLFTALGTLTAESDAVSVIAELEVKFANKPREYDHRNGCGTYNCFRSNVDTTGDQPWQEALRALLLAVNEGINGKEFVVPLTVSVRAPKMEKSVEEFGTRDANDELFLTLYAAHIGIGPPVLATFPINVLAETGDITKNAHGYVVEDDWRDLGMVLNDLNALQLSKSAEGAELAKSIGDAVVRLVRLVADHGFVLLDVKTGNMVARRIGATLAYEVRMIDFGVTFTAQVNLHAKADAERASSDCVFFVNGLLLLNGALRYNSNSLHVFKPLAEELASTWSRMKSTGESSNTLCALLTRDTKQGAAWMGMPNLHRAPQHLYTDTLQSTFYLMLQEYGANEVLKSAKARKPLDESYLGRLVEVMEERVNGTRTPR